MKEICAAHDMRDSLVGIVDHHGELIRKDMVGAMEHEVADVSGEVLRDDSLYGIRQPDIFIARADAHGARPLAGRKAVATGAGVNRTFNSVKSGIGNLPPAAAARVNNAAVREALQCVRVCCPALALPDRRTVPYHAERAERAQDILRCPRRHAGRVDVFDAHEPFTAVAARVKITRNGGDE